MWSVNAFHLAVTPQTAAAAALSSSPAFPPPPPLTAPTDLGSRDASASSSEAEDEAVAEPPDEVSGVEGESDGTRARVHRLRRHLVRQRRRWRALQRRLWEQDPLAGTSPLLAGYGAARQRLSAARSAMAGVLSPRAHHPNTKPRRCAAWLADKVYTAVNTALVLAATVCFVPVVVFGAVATLLASALVHYVMSGYDFAAGDPSSGAAPTVLSARQPPPRRFVPEPSSAHASTVIRDIVAAESSDSGSEGEEENVMMRGRADGRISRVRGRARREGAWASPSPSPGRLSKSSSTEDMMRLVLADDSFLSSLLTELPGVDAASPPVQAAISSMKRGVVGFQ